VSYFTISQMSHDPDLHERVSACAAQEQPDNPVQWAADNMLLLAAAPGWDAAWSSALAAGNPAPGRDEAVITDGMILAAVQAAVAA
jgi:hypothetical protein